MIYYVLARVHPEIQIFTARFAFIAILLAALLWILSVFHVNSATLATLLGSLGLALSLSAQDLFKNLVAGIYLLLERPFVVGDTITIGPHTGQVEVVDLRTITLRTEDHQLVIVPNTLVMSQIVVRKLNIPSPGEPDSSPDESSPSE
jgi:small conductance mechanosensitive channel